MIYSELNFTGGIFFFILLMVLSLFPDAHAGSTVIRDNRVADIAATPVLGRGYSISTNTYQSTCLRDVKTTEPSYDMEYTFDSLEENSSSSRGSRNSRDASAALKANMKIFSARGGKRFNWALTGRSATTKIGNKTFYNHRILVTINIYSYYASVDESRSPMSDVARDLLVNSDLPGFFNSCGAYYVRSIGRKSKFLSVFTYVTKTSKRDFRFEGSLKTQIQSFRLTAGGSAGLSAEADSKQQRIFRRMSSGKRLSITTHAYGMGKDREASLISYDMESFRAAVKDAFIAMQNPGTGKVSAIEIVPWVENAEFQSAVELDQQETSCETGETKKEILLYEKKHILTQNAEFIIEIERADRNLMNTYYKSKLCRKNIDSNWKKDGNMLPEYRDAMIVNRRDGSLQPLGRLDKTLSKEMINKLLEKEKLFMYGSKSNGEGGAAACIREIIKQGIFRKSYRDIKVCKPLSGQLNNLQNDFVSDFCMPVIAVEYN